MIPDLEAVVMKLANFLPRHVIRFVCLERETFGDEECRAEPIFFQKRPSDGVVGADRIVERHDDESVWNRLDGESR